MDSNQMYFFMETVSYQESEPFQMVYQQENVYPNQVNFFCQHQDIQTNPVTDYSSSGMSPFSSDSMFWNNSPSQESIHDLEQNDELFNNIFKADISSEQMDKLLQEIEFDDQMLDFENFPSDTSDYYSSSTPTSANSTPKRKYSSSSSCYSYDFSDCSSPIKKQRKPRRTLPDRKERKKEQNKKAAIKYREKKKNQQQQCTDDVADLETKHSDLSKKLASLQNELRVILPLAKAAFNCDVYKKHQLELLLGRISPFLS